MPRLRSPLWSDPRVQPPYGSVDIDWTSPWAAGLRVLVLCHEGAGPPKNLAAGGRPTTPNVTPRWVTHARGVARAYPAAPQYDALGPNTLLRLPTTRATVLVIRRKLDTTARNSALFGHVSAIQTPRLGAHVPWSDGNVYWDFGGTGANQRLTWTGYTETTANESWCFVYGVTQAIYLNGRQQASQAGGLTRVNDASTHYINTGNKTVHDTDSDLQEVVLFAILDAEWTASQVAQWTGAPYLFLRPIIRGRDVVPAAAPGRGHGRLFGLERNRLVAP